MINASTFGISPSVCYGGGLPDFSDRGSFPTFFVAKSGSFDKSPAGSFMILNRPATLQN
jgi:hypothetical protein